MRKLTTALNLCLFFLLAINTITNGQAGILNPADPIVVYNPLAPPATPPNGTMAKWVKTNRLGWNSTSYKSYHYKGLSFRLKFPKSYVHGVADGKTYPVFVFFHGIGERGTIYDNEYQLYHGGELHKNAVDNGKFDGFELYPQSANTGGEWSPWHFSVIKEIIENYLVPQVKADINRVIIDGLSGGGSATWQFTRTYPQLVAASLPISAPVNVATTNDAISNLKFTPIWTFQGGLDDGPTPFTTESVVNAYKNAGADMTYSLYPNEGHGCWYTAWNEPNFFPFISKAHKANPWPLNGRTEYCPGETINQVIGVTPGFNGYQWRKDGVVISTATGNQITATTLGTYECRILRGSTWSVWSPMPVIIKLKAATIPPSITTVDMASNVIPSPNGTNGVTLQVPSGFASYQWQQVGNSAILGTERTFTTVTPGNYTVRVTEQYGCSSDFSTPFQVINANGANKPEPATGFSATSISKTSIRLDWVDNPSPAFNETNYEIYQSLQEAGPYTLIYLTGSNSNTFTVNNLQADTRYYYKVRAINSFAASAASNITNALTDRDNQAPTTPGNLQISGLSMTSVSLSWLPSTDDVELDKYEVYINGVLSYTTQQTTFTAYNLTYNTSYNFTVKAKDKTGNRSLVSNQVTGQPQRNGLDYKFYTFTGTWNNLPDFNTLVPTATGNMPNVALTPRSQNDNFAFLWEGFIKIPVAGVYSFRTSSDDGSKLYLGSLNQTTSPYGFGVPATVNNDGLHGAVAVTSASLTLAAGVYPIAISFYEQGGGEAMTVSWQTPQNGSFVAIPNSAFTDLPVVNGLPPEAPSNAKALTLSSNSIQVNWVDKSSTENAFEVWRSTNGTTGFVMVGQAPANAASYIDTSLSASTTYYYQVRAINQYGESGFASSIGTGIEAVWKFNNNYTDASGNNRTLTQTSNPVFDANDKKEGTHAIVLNGTNQYASIPTAGTFLQNAYTQKTVLFWAKSVINTGNRFLFDIGASDDGLALRLDNNRLYAGIASNNSRTNFFVDYTSTAWNHIALVYNVNSLKLFVNGVEVGAINDLSFNTLGTTTGAHRIGFGDGSNGNVFQTASPARFNGKLDDFGIYNRALSVAEIAMLMNGEVLPQSVATTQALPVIPSVPAALTASSISVSKIEIEWNDQSTETSYELYRSDNTNGSYVPYAILPIDANKFTDTGLLGNSVYYYKIRAKNAGGYSDFSIEDSAKTGNNLPVIAVVANQQMRYGTQLLVPVSVNDVDQEGTTVSLTGVPASFASYQSTGIGTGNIVFNNPSVSEQGSYQIVVTVTDGNGGSSNTQFDLVVNDNYPPAISPITNVDIAEKQTGQITLNASDLNEGNELTWTFENLPSFVTSTINGRSVLLNIAPGYADHGVYNVAVKISDGNTGVDSKSFTINVSDVDPTYKVYVNFTSGTYQAPAPWNNTNKSPLANDIFANLKDDKGTTTNISLRLLNAWQGINNVGANTGNNSGIYPDAVLRSSYYTNTTVQNVLVSGLTVGSKYTFTFLGSRYNPTGNVMTVYSIGSESVTLDPTNNYLNTVSINNVQPDSNGTITFRMNKAAGATFGYINSVVIESVFDDGSVPARPRSLGGVFKDGKAHLTWIDAAFNESMYEVYRSDSLNGSYSLINPGANNANSSQYDDAAVTGNKTYYYTVRAINNSGQSPYSDTVSVTTANTSPTLAQIADVSMKTGEDLSFNISTTFDPGETVVLKISGAPSFVKLVDNGNGSGVITIQPGATIGVFENITITATDNGGASGSRSFKITIVDPSLITTYVNFNQTFPVTGWNNMNSAPSANAGIVNLKDKENVATGMNISLIDAWVGASTGGTLTGNNSGVYPDDILRTSYYDAATSARRILLSGLAANKKYTLIFFASRASAGALVTRYTAGGKSADLNVDNNTNQTVKLSDLSPNANGQIEITVTKIGSSSYAYIGALEIQSYPYDAVALPPVNVKATGLTTDKIKIDWTGAGSLGTGYELWRSTTYNGTYTKIADLPFSSVTYTNTDLSGGSAYYYKIRTIVSPGIFTTYSNIASASTVSYLVNINLNDDISNAQGNGWNNINTLLFEGYKLSNLVNSQNRNTGIDFSIVENFSGFNSAIGLNTGNNSGAVPDNVMKSFYFLTFADTARFRFDGLNQASQFNIIFYAGSSYNQTNNTVYKIGNQTVSLNSYNNYNNTVKISNVKPDENGSILVTVYSSVGYGFLNSVSLEAIPVVNDNGEGQTSFAVIKNPVPATRNIATVAATTAETNIIQDVAFDAIELKAFPNPFVSDVTLQLNLKQDAAKFIVVLSDISGKEVYRKAFSNVSRGIWRQQLGLNSTITNRGTYILQVIGLDSKRRVVKLIRN